MNRSIFVAVSTAVLSMLSIGETSAQFAPGDLFVSTLHGKVQWRDATGQHLKGILDTGQPWEVKGTGFDAAGNLFVTEPSAVAVSKFDHCGRLMRSYNMPPGWYPECIAVDSAGNFYVSGADGGQPIAQYDSAGHLLNVLVQGSRVDWFDFGADQCTLYYTYENWAVNSVSRVNLCNGETPTFLPATLGVGYAIRRLPTGGFLVATANNVTRLDGSGNIVQTYTIPGSSFLFSLTLALDATSFWVGDLETGMISQVALSTGQVLNSFSSIDATSGDSGGSGLSVYAGSAIGIGCTPPVILRQPQNSFPCSGDTTTFNVEVEASCDSLNFQWQRQVGSAWQDLTDGNDVSGSQTAVLTIAPASSSNIGNYRVIISNPCGSQTSDVAALEECCVPPSSTPPQSLQVCAGGTATFWVASTGSDPMTFQWQKQVGARWYDLNDGGSISGSQTSILTIFPVSAFDGGNYRVILHNPCGSATSETATLQNCCAPAPPGLINWWRAERNTTDTMRNNDATPEGNLGYADGEVGRAFAFNGIDAAVDLISGFSSQDFSMGFWINPASAGWQSQAATLIDSSAGGNGGWSLVSQYGNFSWNITCWDGNIISVPFNLSPDTWQYVVLTMDGGDMATVYVNGAQMGQAELTMPIAYGGETGSELLLGRSGGGGQYFTGLLDEVDLYDHALSPDDVWALSSAGGAGKCQPVCDPPPQGLISWWRGENNARDYMGNYDGTPEGNVNYGSGMVGWTFSFDSSAGSPGPVDLVPQMDSQVFTVSMWVKPASIAWQSDGATLLDDSIGGQGWSVVYRYAYPSFSWNISCWGGSTVQLPFDLPPDSWHHLALAMDGGDMATIYVDGVQVGQAQMPMPILYGPEGSLEMRLGGPGFTGAIDEVQFYDHPLSAGEVQGIFNARSAGTCLPACIPPPGGLVSWWRAEGNTTDSLGQHNGTPEGTLAYTNGKVARAFSLDGSGAAKLAPGITWQNFSVGMWVKARSIAWQSDGGTLLDDSSNGNGGWNVAYHYNGPNFSWSLACLDGNTVSLPFALPPDLWHYLTLTMDGGTTATVYVDGVQAGQPRELTAPISYVGGSGQELLLGRWGGGGRYFNGLVDEVDLYDRPLSPTEVQALYNAGSLGKCP